MSEVIVNSAQLLTAARLLRDAEPTVANGVSAERPAYLSDDPNDNRIVVFTIGIITQSEYRINQHGKCEVERPNTEGDG